MTQSVGKYRFQLRQISVFCRQVPLMFLVLFGTFFLVGVEKKKRAGVGMEELSVCLVE